MVVEPGHGLGLQEIALGVLLGAGVLGGGVVYRG